MFIIKKEQRNYCALPHKLMGGATLLKFGCRNRNNLLIHRDLFKKKKFLTIT